MVLFCGNKPDSVCSCSTSTHHRLLPHTTPRTRTLLTPTCPPTAPHPPCVRRALSSRPELPQGLQSARLRRGLPLHPPPLPRGHPPLPRKRRRRQATRQRRGARGGVAGQRGDRLSGGAGRGTCGFTQPPSPCRRSVPHIHSISPPAPSPLPSLCHPLPVPAPLSLPHTHTNTSLLPLPLPPPHTQCMQPPPVCVGGGQDWHFVDEGEDDPEGLGDVSAVVILAVVAVGVVIAAARS